ncbi:MAG: AarF/UbiB family protein [Nocardioidaceae bacterium]
MVSAAPGLDAPACSRSCGLGGAEVDYDRRPPRRPSSRQTFRDDPAFVVPAVVANTERVLVSEWVDGTHVARIASRGSVAEPPAEVACPGPVPAGAKSGGRDHRVLCLLAARVSVRDKAAT